MTVAIAATNHQGLLDPALWRRFDEIVFFGLPNSSRIEDLCAESPPTAPIPVMNLRVSSAGLVGLSHADVERIARDAVKDMLLNEPGPVTPAALEAALARQRKRTDAATPMTSQPAPRKKAPRRGRAPVTCHTILKISGTRTCR